MKSTLLMLAGALVLTTALVETQVSATLILTSGDTVRGNLVDMNGSGFEFSVDGESRSFGAGEVAAITFTGSGSDVTASETSQIQAGRALVVMRNGDTWSGTLVDMSERDPLRITLRADGSERQVMSNQVARILLRSWTNMPTGGGQASQLPASPGSYTLVGNRQWRDTTINVTRGQRVSFSVTGEIRLSNNADDIARAAGSVQGRAAGRGAPLPNALTGAVIGRIGPSGQPFGIGNQTQAIAMPAGGRLWIGINDAQLNDNSGEFTVEVRVR